MKKEKVQKVTGPQAKAEVLTEIGSLTRNGDSMWTYWVKITIEQEGAKREFVRKFVIFA